MLLCHAIGCDRAYLYAHGSDEMTELAWIHFGRYLNDRLKGKPTQYITHRQEFYGRDFFVNADVLIPRPETEHLVEAALPFARRENANLLDVGTGSGAIAITLALESGRAVLASDISCKALLVANRNRDKHGACVSFLVADLLEAIRPASIDLLLSNPPYVPGADAANMQREVRDWEPHVALFAGDTGLEIYGRLIRSRGHRCETGRTRFSGAWIPFSCSCPRNAGRALDRYCSTLRSGRVAARHWSHPAQLTVSILCSA